MTDDPKIPGVRDFFIRTGTVGGGVAVPAGSAVLVLPPHASPIAFIPALAAGSDIPDHFEAAAMLMWILSHGSMFDALIAEFRLAQTKEGSTPLSEILASAPREDGSKKEEPN